MEQEEKLNKPVVGEFKGNPILTLNPDERYPFSFGLSKARLILAHLMRSALLSNNTARVKADSPDEGQRKKKGCSSLQPFFNEL